MEPEVVRIQPHAEGKAQRPLLIHQRWRLHKEQGQEEVEEQEEQAAEETVATRNRRQKPPPVWLCWRTTACVYLTTQEPLYLQAERLQMMGRWSVRPALCHRVTAIKPQRRQGSHGQHDRLMTGAPGTWSGSGRARNGSNTAFVSPIFLMFVPGLSGRSIDSRMKTQIQAVFPPQVWGKAGPTGGESEGIVGRLA